MEQPLTGNVTTGVVRVGDTPSGGRSARGRSLLRRGARDGVQPWARIHAEDGAYWQATADLLDAHVDRWTAALV
ncbi:hypothetical protein ACGFI9_01850 [Micromonospora sp. NPDC048930]|uniref:hypothetical protein n=1 Tax=Micromonospora sp. NPDC048930 TaxID=3364261 RepID=UPI003711E15A